jgi:hypothetical protein
MPFDSSSDSAFAAAVDKPDTTDLASASGVKQEGFDDLDQAGQGSTHADHHPVDDVAQSSGSSAAAVQSAQGADHPDVVKGMQPTAADFAHEGSGTARDALLVTGGSDKGLDDLDRAGTGADKTGLHAPTSHLDHAGEGHADGGSHGDHGGDSDLLKGDAHLSFGGEHDDPLGTKLSATDHIDVHHDDHDDLTGGTKGEGHLHDDDAGHVKGHATSLLDHDTHDHH